MKSVLDNCYDNHFSSICLPAYSTGGGGVSKSAFLSAIFESMIKFSKTAPSKICLVVFGQDAYKEYVKEFKKLWSPKFINSDHLKENDALKLALEEQK